MRFFASQSLLWAALATAAAACPQEPSGAEKTQCVTPNNWSDLKNIVEKGNRVVLCPFTMTVTATDAPLRLRKKHEILCANKGQCVIQGGRTHAKLSSPAADVSIYGLVFKDATKSSMFVLGNAGNNEHSICHTTFDSNEGPRGAAIRAAGGTKVSISNSVFVNNEGVRGTINSAGEIIVSNTRFEGNEAKKDGAAILLASPNGKATVSNTDFINNKGKGQFISGAAIFNNGGGNKGTGNTGKCGANGAFLRETKTCVFFSSAPTPTTTPKPPTSTTTTPKPPTPTPPSGKYPVHPVPKNPPVDYFNYDYSDNDHGPNAWHKIPATKTRAYEYWKDLEKYMPVDMTKNTCNSRASFNENKGSPVDVRTTDDRCMEFHQIRPNQKTQHMPLLGPVGKSAELEITSHSLRINYPRVPKEDLTVPSADIPMGWGKFLHVAYCEFKVPASHSIQGKKFDAEMNCFIIQKAGRGLAVFTILFEVGKFNSHLEHAISAFDTVHMNHELQCPSRARRFLNETTVSSPTPAPSSAPTVPAPSSTPSSTPTSAPTTASTSAPTVPVPSSAPSVAPTSAPTDEPDEETQMRMQSPFWNKGWNPFQFYYQTKSWWFYGYRGTLMEPPCYQMVEYRIIDTPATMSAGQLENMKRILFTHQDPKTCQYTSVHNKEESVVREVQPSKRTRIHRCTCRDFVSDKERNATGKRSCPADKIDQWMPNPRDLKPAPGQWWDGSG